MATPTTLPAAFVAGNVLTAAQMNDLRGAFRVLQVVSTNKTDAFSTTSTSLVDITGLSATITPSATSSRVLVIVQLAAVGTTASFYRWAMLRGSTLIGVGDTAGSRSRFTGGGFSGNNGEINFSGGMVLDSPATTSATTYKTQILGTGSNAFVNRQFDDADGAGTGRYASTITLMEISA